MSDVHREEAAGERGRMTASASFAILLAVLAAAAEVWISLEMTEAWQPAGLWLVMAFLASPLLFLALLAWRRRTHPGRSLLLLAVIVLLGGIGCAIFGNDLARFRTEVPGQHKLHLDPVFV